MCELFGYQSDSLIQETELLTKFFARSRIHPDGWGLYRTGGGQSCLHREALPAWKSERNRRLLENDRPASTLIAHIRYATEGSVRPGNVHPFQLEDPDGRLMTLAHCGSLPAGNPADPFIPYQLGSTDSERILLFIGDRLLAAKAGRKSPLTGSERIAVYEKAAADLSDMNKINLLMTDGEYFYAHCNVRGRLYTAEDDGTVYFASYRIPNRKLDWKPLPPNRLMVYQNGCLICEGPARGRLFEPAVIPQRREVLI